MLSCFIKRGWIVLSISLLSACGSESGRPEIQQPEQTTKKVVTVTSLSPLEVDVGVEVDFIVSGKNLDDEVVFEMTGCSSSSPLTDGDGKLVFRCTPTLAGTYEATIRSGDGKLLESYPVIINDEVIRPPVAPKMLKTEANSGFNVLSWSKLPDVTYRLYYRPIFDPSSPWREVDSGITKTSYEHTLTDSHLYEYAVSAVNAGGESQKRTETEVVPLLQVKGLSKMEGSGDVMTPFEFEATLNRAATKTVTASYRTVADSADENDDYLPVNNGKMEFPVGDTSVTVSIAVVADPVVESNESFYLYLNSPANAVLVSDSAGDTRAKGTILNDDEPPSPKVTELTPLEVTVNSETDFIVTGQFLSDQIDLEIEDCSSVVLLEGGDESERKFRCTPLVIGEKLARVLAADNEVLQTFKIRVMAAEDILASGKITRPVAGESYDGDIEIAVDAMDSDGLQKVSVNFSVSNKKIILCSGNCTGNSGSWTTKINPAAYYYSVSDSVTLELWVLDMNDKNVKVDEVTFQWQPLFKNYSLPLNDTGVTRFFTATGMADEEPDDFPGQDASYGRDIVAAYSDDGHAGFSFTKIDSDGNDLPASATEWSCVRDNVTGLLWEVKTDDGGLHDKDARFSWWKADGRGKEDRFRGCYGYSSGAKETYCNTDSYIKRVNSLSLCGSDQWRLPMRRELISLLNSERTSPAIDIDWFPHTASGFYWASQQSSGIGGWAFYSWGVDFDKGFIDGISWEESAAVRLVSHASDR